MRTEYYSRKKKIWVFILLWLPLLISIFLIVYLKLIWRVDVGPNEKLSPINNKPLFVGLIIFTLGYLFFLGMLFSENILNMFNRRRFLYGR